MNSHLTILADNKPLALDDEFRISVEMSNPLFNDVDMFSYPLQLPLEGNRHFVKNLDDVNSDIRPINYEHTPMQIMADGLPFASGVAIMQEDETIEDSLSLNIEGNQTSFRNLISDIECRDVPVKDDIVIGYKLGGVHVKAGYDVKFWTNVNMGTVSDTDGWGGDEIREIFQAPSGKVSGTMESDFEPQALGFSVPDNLTTEYIDRAYDNGNVVKVPVSQRKYINTSAPYGSPDLADRPATYCNARVCYKHYAYNESEKKTADYTIAKTDSKNLYEDIYPYWVLDADRPQSGICFYVLYFLECLFQHIGYEYDIDDLKKIEDFKRLAFYTTRCKYDIHEEDKNFVNVIAGLDNINQWLKDHGCGGQLELNAKSEKKSIGSIQYGDTTYKAGEWYYGTYTYGGPEIRHYTYRVDSIDMETVINSKKTTVSAHVLPMYANSDNFPDMPVATLLESLEAQFGIRFIVDENIHKVRATIFRDVFRDKNAPRNFSAQIHSFNNISEKITGVKVGYSAESDYKEQQANIRHGVRDYDTDYDYCEYPKSRTISRERLYQEIFFSPGYNDMNVYVDLTTGNTYRMKVDSEANAISDLHPIVFEVAMYYRAEFGDCSPINEDYIKEFRSDLQPVPLSDVNYYNERNIVSGSNKDVDIEAVDGTGHKTTMSGDVIAVSAPPSPILVPYCDEDMEHEFVEQRINNVISEGLADAYITTYLRLQESYDPSKTEDGNSPLQTYDWGNAICIMRGGGDKDGIMIYDSNYDGFDNSKWKGTVGNYQISTDSITQFGGGYDYHGEQFSLKPRAWVQPEWADAPLVVNDPLVKNRGYVDTFLTEYIHFLLNRKKYRIRCLCSVAQIADIPNHWKEWWNIGGKKCLINKVSTDISVDKGMGEVELEVYSL